MATTKQTLKARISATAGPRRNMNGAGAGGRLVANRQRNSSSMSQLGNRSQRYRDIRKAFGLSAG